jgi:hypothetical protein
LGALFFVCWYQVWDVDAGESLDLAGRMVNQAGKQRIEADREEFYAGKISIYDKQNNFYSIFSRNLSTKLITSMLE